MNKLLLLTMRAVLYGLALITLAAFAHYGLSLLDIGVVSTGIPYSAAVVLDSISSGSTHLIRTITANTAFG